MQPEPAHSVITRNNSPDIPFDLSINPYRGCEHGCVYCLSGDTPILMGDGSQKPLATLLVGDEIYGTAKRGHYRQYVRTRVLAHWRTNKPAWRIRLADGTELVASADHRFLTERGWKFVAPTDKQRPHLTLNNTLMGFGAIASGPTGVHSSEYRQGYLCGIIRGDGHLAVHRYSRPGRANADQHQFRLAMTDGQALDRATDFLDGFGIGTHRFLHQAETTLRRRMEAIRTSARASVAAIGRLIAWPERPDADWARGFVGGIFDAEGSFDGNTIRIANTDRRIIDVLRDCLESTSFRLHRRNAKGKRPETYSLCSNSRRTPGAPSLHPRVRSFDREKARH